MNNQELKIGKVYTNTVEAPVVAETEVLIAGGGTAGCVAAIAAARNGAKVLLVERRGFLGGMMTAGNAGLTKYIVHEKSQSEYRKVVAELDANPSAVQVVGGIPMEITQRLLDMKSGIGTNNKAGSYVFTASEDFKWLLLTMMEEAGVELLFHSFIVDVIKEDNMLTGVVIENKSGRQVIAANMFIDTTGDGDVSAKAGAPFNLGVVASDLSAKTGIPLQSMHAMGVMFKAGNIDMNQCFEYLKLHPDKGAVQTIALLSIEEAHKAFLKGDMMTILVTGGKYSFQIYNTPIPGVFVFCCPCYEGNGLSSQDLTQGEIALAKEVWDRVNDMKKSLPGFEDVYLLDCPEICVRETRHIECEYKLNIEDIYTSRDFEDAIGRGSHPIDANPVPENLRHQPIAKKWYFNIPYRSLVAKQVDNILVAGRCISVTHEAAGCTRTTVQCMITGEAAGTAAAMCCKQKIKPRELDTTELREKLKKQNVVC